MHKTALALLVLSASTAAAESYDVGIRVGGYGFRREGSSPEHLWDECRMNGLGIFGSRSVRGPIFVEAGIDMYGSVEPQPMDLQLDRTSGLFSTAIGARTQVASWLRGYVQIGAGLELTRVSVQYGDSRIRDNKAMPEGFFGAGMELRLAKGTYGGASIRTLLMGNFDYDPARLDENNGWLAAPASSEVFEASPDVAAQAQFYVRREL